MNRYTIAALLITLTGARAIGAAEEGPRLAVGLLEVAAYRDDAISHLKNWVADEKISLSPAQLSKFEAFGRSIKIQTAMGDDPIGIGPGGIWKISEDALRSWDAEPVLRETKVLELLLLGYQQRPGSSFTSDLLLDEAAELLEKEARWVNFRGKARLAALGHATFLQELRKTDFSGFSSAVSTWKKSKVFGQCSKSGKKRNTGCDQALERFGAVKAQLDEILALRLEELRHLREKTDALHAELRAAIPGAKPAWITSVQPLFPLRLNAAAVLDRRAELEAEVGVAEYDQCFTQGRINADLVRCLARWSENYPRLFDSALEIETKDEVQEILSFIQGLQARLATP